MKRLIYPLIGAAMPLVEEFPGFAKHREALDRASRRRGARKGTG